MAQTNSRVFASPIGLIRIWASKNGIERIEECNDDIERDKIVLETNNDEVDRHLDTCLLWLKCYFQVDETDETRQQAEEPLLDFEAHKSGPFFQNVWKTLKDKTKPGQVVSYGELAKMSGSPGASQAVGTAMKSNPFPLVVPCHRVILSDGNIGKYSYGRGTTTKQWLLNHEMKIRNDELANRQTKN